MSKKLIAGAALAVIALPIAGFAMAQGAPAEPPLPRDRQVLVTRHLGHLQAVDNVRCIQRRRVRDLSVISDRRILFRAGRNLVFDAQLNDGCSGMVHAISIPRVAHSRSQLCSGDTIEVVDLGSNASCTVESFVVWERRAPGAPPE